MYQQARQRLAERPKVKVFSNSGAVTFEAHAEPGYATVNIECAPRAQGSKEILWRDEKITLQLTEDELALTAAFFSGLWKSDLDFKREGKGLQIRRQSNSVHLRASAGRGKLVNLQLAPVKSFSILGLLYQQLLSASVTADMTQIKAQLSGMSRLAHSLTR